MLRSRVVRSGLAIAVAGALAVGAGVISAAPAAAAVSSVTFHAIGGPQSFVVPAGVCKVSVNVLGGAGGSGLAFVSTGPFQGALTPQPGGLGGRATGALTVTPGQTLQIVVGDKGGNSNSAGSGTSHVGLGGYPNGGDGAGRPDRWVFGAGGGGSSAIVGPGGPLVVVGGGGGAGGLGSTEPYQGGGVGGNGGPAGTNGTNATHSLHDAGGFTVGIAEGGRSGGNGGAGGLGAPPVQSGYSTSSGVSIDPGGEPGGNGLEYAQGGRGGVGGLGHGPNNSGGGGGGGYVGGGGGGASGRPADPDLGTITGGGGGGGGSSLTPAGLVTTAGVNSGNGSIALSYDTAANTCGGGQPPTVPVPGLDYRTVTSLSSSEDLTLAGAPVTFTANVTPKVLAGPATGTVSFTANGASIAGCVGVVLVAGKAPCVTSGLGAGVRTIAATYAPTGQFLASSSSLSHIVVLGQGATKATYNFTGGAQSFVVPQGVCQVTVDVNGAAGGAAGRPITNGTIWRVDPGGPGGRALGLLDVTPGETLNVVVGGKGGDSASNVYSNAAPFPAGSSHAGAGGYPNGGAGAATSLNSGGFGAGGGGSSSIVRSGQRLVVAGGGGGTGGQSYMVDFKNGGLLHIMGKGGTGGGAGTKGGDPYTGIAGGSYVVPNPSMGGAPGGTGGAGGVAGSSPWTGNPGLSGLANNLGGTGGAGGIGAAGALAGAGGGGGGGGYHGGGGGGGRTFEVPSSNIGAGGGGGGSGHGPVGVVTSNGTNLSNGTIAISYSLAAANCEDPPAPPVATVPSVPQWVTAVSGNGQVAVSWLAPTSNGGSPITGYVVTASPGGATCSTAGLSCTIAGLTNGTAYSFTVKATNVAGSSAASAPSRSVAPATAPGVPQSVTGVAGNGQVAVSWSAPTSNGGAPIAAYTVVASPGGRYCLSSGTSCTISLTNGTAYTFTVRATNVAGSSAASAPSEAVTPGSPPPVPTAPSVPRTVTGVAGNGQVAVSWLAPTSTGGSAITGYTATANPGGQTCTTAGLSCTITGLTNGTAYTFTAKATNAVGTSAASTSSGSVTPATVPSVPRTVTGVAGDGQVAVSWLAPTSTGGSAITGYTATANPGGQTCSTAGLSCTVTGLTNGTAYTFTVKATNAVGTSAESVASGSVTPTAVPTVPSVPRTVTGVAGNAQVVVSWLAPTSTGGSPITGYTATASPGGATCSTAGLSCTVTGLTNGTAYTFKVKATNAVGTSGASAASAAVTPVAPPTAPTVPRTVTGVAGNAQVTASWVAPTSTGGSPITGYTATASPGGKTCTTAGLSCTITGLTNGTGYVVRVKATNAVGTSGASAPSASVTPVAPPPGVSSVPLFVSGTAGSGRVTASWMVPTSPGGSPITGYTATASPGGQSCSSASRLYCAITGLTNGTAYTVTVKATNGAGSSAASVPSGVLTPVAAQSFSDVSGSHPFAGHIGWLASSGVTSGYVDGTFRPTSPVSRQAMASFIWRYQGQPHTTLSEPFFADVSPSNPFYDAIQFMAESGLSVGSTNPAGGKPLYKPGDVVSRQAFAAFIWRATGEPATGLGTAFFADVGPANPFYDAIQWMAESEMSLGSTNPAGGKPLYNPGDAVSRQTMAAFLARYDTL